VGLSISVFGMGYVGSVTAACFAHVGHKVTGVDVRPTKVERMAAGRPATAASYQGICW
jgi:GDP-mannose 6-dehydrogenase